MTSTGKFLMVKTRVVTKRFVRSVPSNYESDPIGKKDDMKDEERRFSENIG